MTIDTTPRTAAASDRMPTAASPARGATARTSSAVTPLDHVALCYRDPEEYQTAVVRFVREALAADRPVLMAAPGEAIGRVRSRLGGDRGSVEFVDLTEAGRNPGRILPAVLLDFAARHPDRPLSIICEHLWPGRGQAEYPACCQHDALVNAAFAAVPAAIMCPYDVSALPPAWVAEAARTHSAVIEDGGRRPTEGAGLDPLTLAADYNLPLPAPPADALCVRFTQASELAELRRTITAAGQRAGLPADRAARLIISVTELATNSLEHSGGPGELRIWSTEETLICQIDDAGRVTDPLAGRTPPTADQSRGRGLLLVNQLCDLVRMHSRPDGTTFRVYSYR